MKTFVFLLSLGIASAEISIQPFTDSTCGTSGGSSLSTVSSNSANAEADSGCVITGDFNSINVISADPGFQCDIFRDDSCQEPGGTVFEPLCTGAIGRAVRCFIDNPLADSTAQVTLGNSQIAAKVGFDGGDLVSTAARSACGTNGCDPNTKFTDSYDNSECIDPRDCPREICNQRVTMTGNYDNANQRDYMSALLQTTMKNAGGGNSKVTRDAARIQDQMSFAQVVINDQNGNNQAEMAVSVEVECETVSPSGIDCDGLLATITSTLLGAVPGVGGLLAGGFEIACLAGSG